MWNRFLTGFFKSYILRIFLALFIIIVTIIDFRRNKRLKKHDWSQNKKLEEKSFLLLIHSYIYIIFIHCYYSYILLQQSITTTTKLYNVIEKTWYDIIYINICYLIFPPFEISNEMSQENGPENERVNFNKKQEQLIDRSIKKSLYY